MYNILINTSNLKTGGAIQVADSICRLLNNYPQHYFYVVLSGKLEYLTDLLSSYANVKHFTYTQKITIHNVITGKDHFLDDIVKKYNINAVLSIFGPSRWKPSCFHLVGFAMPHIVLPESPFWQKLSFIDFLKTKLRVLFMKRDFRKNSTALWCENEYISTRLKNIFPKKRSILSLIIIIKFLILQNYGMNQSNYPNSMGLPY